MGNQSSKSTNSAEIVNKALTQVLMESSNNCKQNTANLQTIEFSKIKADKGCSLNFSNISQKAMASPNFTCSSDTQNSSAMADQVKNELEQSAKAETSGLSGAFISSSESNNMIRAINDISKNINIKNLSDCVSDTLQKQTANFTEITASCPAYCRDPNHIAGPYDNCKTDFNNLSQELISKAVAQCSASNQSLSQATTTFDNTMKQVSEAKNKGINIAASLGGSLLFWCCICIICIFFFMPGFGGDGGSGSSSTEIKISPEMATMAAAAL
jgi:hypothetical protein